MVVPSWSQWGEGPGRESSGRAESIWHLTPIGRAVASSRGVAEKISTEPEFNSPGGRIVHQEHLRTLLQKQLGTRVHSNMIRTCIHTNRILALDHDRDLPVDGA